MVYQDKLRGVPHAHPSNNDLNGGGETKGGVLVEPTREEEFPLFKDGVNAGVRERVTVACHDCV